MGEARRRGTFEERKAQAVARREEQRKKWLEERRKIDDETDRIEAKKNGAQVAVIGHGRMNHLTAMLALAAWEERERRRRGIFAISKGAY